MLKSEAIARLGGSIEEAARWIGVAEQAVRHWPAELSRVQQDRVEAAEARKRAIEARELSPLSKGLLRQLVGQDAAADQISIAAAEKMMEDIILQAAALAAERVVCAFNGLAADARAAIVATSRDVSVPTRSRRVPRAANSSSAQTASAAAA